MRFQLHECKSVWAVKTVTEETKNMAFKSSYLLEQDTELVLWPRLRKEWQAPSVVGSNIACILVHQRIGWPVSATCAGWGGGGGSCLWTSKRQQYECLIWVKIWLDIITVIVDACHAGLWVTTPWTLTVTSPVGAVEWGQTWGIRWVKWNFIELNTDFLKEDITDQGSIPCTSEPGPTWSINPNVCTTKTKVLLKYRLKVHHNSSNDPHVEIKLSSDPFGLKKPFKVSSSVQIKENVCLFSTSCVNPVTFILCYLSSSKVANSVNSVLSLSHRSNWNQNLWTTLTYLE